MAKIATREAYGKALAALAQQRSDILVLDADLTKSTKTSDVVALTPHQHFNMGIAEGNMMAVAAGMAANGKTVFASTFAMFAAGRAFEQIRNSIGYPHLNVKICATHSGLSVGEDGASHQAIEDIALMRSIPGMLVVQPCDARETKAAIEAVATYQGPAYVRLGRLAVEEVFTNEEYTFTLGKGIVMRKGQRVAIVATGLMVQEAQAACDALEAQGIHPTLVNMHTIKPIDQSLLIDLAKTHELIISVEEHTVMGGLGSAIAEVLIQNQPVRQIMMGVQDVFGESGKPMAILEKHQLNAAGI
ncbi:MAG: transketolase family protein, partial [Erysipelotrichaceae bacterium]